MAGRPFREPGAIDMPAQCTALADALERLPETALATREMLDARREEGRYAIRVRVAATADREHARQARLVDGADEVHRMVLNRFLQSEGPDFWRWTVAGETPR